MTSRVRLPEELLVEAVDARRLVLSHSSPLSGRTVVFHGHCHQKAEVGTSATVALLQRIPSVAVVELDAARCGLAGVVRLRVRALRRVPGDRRGPPLPSGPRGVR